MKEKKFEVKFKSNFFIIRNFLKNCKIFFKTILSIISIMYWIIISKFDYKNQNISSENNILIHHSMDINKFKKDFKLEIDTFISQRLSKKIKNIYHLVWFYNFWFNRSKILKKIKEKSGFIVENFVNLNDIIEGTKNFVKTKKTILGCDNYYEINIKDLLLRESHNYLDDSFSNLRFWLYKPALQK